VQTSLVAFLVILLIAAIASYRFGFKRPWHVLQHRLQAAFVVLVFLLIPLVVAVLWQQTRATDELADIGIVPHPSLTESAGIDPSRRQAGERVWLFHSDQSPATVLDFYRNPGTRPEWQLTSESPMLLTLRRGAQRLTIAASESRTETVVVYSLRHETDAGQR
jgi:hypothetical protein